MIWLKLCIILLCIHLVLSSDNNDCVSNTPCECVLPSKECINLSKAGSPDYPRFDDVFFEATYNSTVQLYSYNPCFAFDSIKGQTKLDSGHKPCKDAAACIKIPGGTDGERSEEYAIGIQTTGSFGYNGNDHYIKYTVEGTNITLTVNLICNNDTEYNLTMEQPLSAENFDIVMNLISKYACKGKCSSSPPSSSPGLSVGSKLLIAFFTLLAAYLIVGVLWKFCNGAHGTELIPNIQFWNELPTLIMEGVLFTCSCFSRNNSYGDI